MYLSPMLVGVSTYFFLFYYEFPWKDNPRAELANRINEYLFASNFDIFALFWAIVAGVGTWVMVREL